MRVKCGSDLRIKQEKQRNKHIYIVCSLYLNIPGPQDLKSSLTVSAHLMQRSCSLVYITNWSYQNIKINSHSSVVSDWLPIRVVPQCLIPANLISENSPQSSFSIIKLCAMGGRGHQSPFQSLERSRKVSIGTRDDSSGHFWPQFLDCATHQSSTLFNSIIHTWKNQIFSFLKLSNV